MLSLQLPESALATPSQRPCPLRRAALAAGMVVGQALLAPFVAHATEALDPGPAVDADAAIDTGTVLGLDALELMRRERRELRGAPRMLPLLATRTEHGRFWLGLSRGGSDAGGERALRLELVWLIPLGR